MGRALFALTVALVACDPYGSSESAKTGEDGGTGTPADGGSADAGGGVDATSGMDASPDGGTAPCPEVLHDEFDAIALDWFKSEKGGTIIADGVLKVTIGPQSDYSQADIKRDLDAAVGARVRVGFTLDVKSAPSTGYIEYGCTLQLRGDDPSSFYSLYLAMIDGKLAADDDAKLKGADVTTGSPKAFAGFVLGKKHSVVLEVGNITATGGHALAIADGVTFLERDVAFPAPMTGITVRCGTTYSSANVSGSAEIDDLSVAVCK